MKKLFTCLMVLVFQIPLIRKLWIIRFKTPESKTVPWTSLKKSLPQCRIALITTGGVHLKSDDPFDMNDKDGDPTYRKIPSTATAGDLCITHDYYDHRDADEDINLVLPIDVLKEAQNTGLVGESSEFFYGLMGHIEGHHLQTLLEQTAKSVVQDLQRQKVDIALLVPA
jgi:D-proline reductase (dithiol) PrdB